MSLDGFRYEGLPGVVAARAKGKTDDGYECGYLEKEELVRLVEWKMYVYSFPLLFVFIVLYGI